jgi:hypothetical protein
MDVNTFSVTASHPTHLLAGTSCDVRALVRVTAADVDEHAVDVSLRLWTPLGATVIVLRERSPGRFDLRDRAVQLDERTVEYATGRWTDSAREYELAVALPRRAAGDEMLTARLAIVVDGEIACRTPIIVTWTADERLIAAIRQPPEPATYARADAIADLPTGPSPEPRHSITTKAPAATHCAACGLQADDDDRFCERCGHPLTDAQKS